jgi:hypothetical protein
MVERVIAIPRRSGVWLALLALAFQLGLSIGHVHEIGPSWGSATPPSQAKPMFVPAGEGSPAGIPTIPAEDQCPICFGLAVSGTFILAAAILVKFAPVLTAARLETPAEIADLPLQPFSPVQPRAPPPTAILA